MFNIGVNFIKVVVRDEVIAWTFFEINKWVDNTFFIKQCCFIGSQFAGLSSFYNSCHTLYKCKFYSSPLFIYTTVLKKQS